MHDCSIAIGLLHGPIARLQSQVPEAASWSPFQAAQVLWAEASMQQVTARPQPSAQDSLFVVPCRQHVCLGQRQACRKGTSRLQACCKVIQTLQALRQRQPCDLISCSQGTSPGRRHAARCRPESVGKARCVASVHVMTAVSQPAGCCASIKHKPRCTSSSKHHIPLARWAGSYQAQPEHSWNLPAPVAVLVSYQEQCSRVSRQLQQTCQPSITMVEAHPAQKGGCCRHQVACCLSPQSHFGGHMQLLGAAGAGPQRPGDSVL